MLPLKFYGQYKSRKILNRRLNAFFCIMPLIRLADRHRQPHTHTRARMKRAQLSNKRDTCIWRAIRRARAHASSRAHVDCMQRFNKFDTILKIPSNIYIYI